MFVPFINLVVFIYGLCGALLFSFGLVKVIFICLNLLKDEQ